MRTCKLHLNKRIWARKLVRWLGFELVPDYTLEDIEIRIFIPNTGSVREERLILTGMTSNTFEYYDEDTSTFKGVDKSFINTDTTQLVKFHYKKKFMGCPIVDSEDAWEKRLKQSKEKVARKVGK